MYPPDQRTAQVSIESKVFYTGLKDELHLFNYLIRIKNQLKFPIKLVSRKWVIHDINNEDRTVKGRGVVGLQPVLEPGETFTYESYCPLISGYGRMQGHFVFEHLPNKVRFRVEIPSFTLVRKDILN